MQRVLDLQTIQNARDLGGYRIDDHWQTAWRLFVRTGDMDQVSTPDQDGLVDYGIRTVIDLRMARELETLPNAMDGHDTIAFRHHDFWGKRFDDYRSKRRGAAAAVKLADLYCAGLVESGFVMRDIVETIAAVSDSGGVAYHCRSGKDRTGLVSMVLLGIAGVPASTICTDYALTSRYLDLGGGKRVQPGQPGYFLLGCEPETMQRTLAFLDAEYGGVEAYLRDIGTAPDAIDAIRMRFRVPSR